MSNEVIVATQPNLPPAIQLLLDDKLFERAKQIASYLAKADGFTPSHLVNKSEACFFVVTRAIGWRLDPFAVACSTFQFKGKVGFEGKLCQAIIENSGQVEGGVKYRTYGDWTKVQGKFKTIDGDKGKYQVPTYNEKDEEGLGVIAHIRVKGEMEDREFKIDLREAQPRNSTLWATNPLQQLKYRAVRGLGNSSMPGIFMGVPFDRDDFVESAKDVTPKNNSPLKEAFMENATVSETETVEKPKNKMDEILSRPAPKPVMEEPAQQDLVMSPAQQKCNEIITLLQKAKTEKDIKQTYEKNQMHIQHMDEGLQGLINATIDEKLKSVK